MKNTNAAGAKTTECFEIIKRIESELKGIAPEDLTHAERNILRHVKAATETVK